MMVAPFPIESLTLRIAFCRLLKVNRCARNVSERMPRMPQADGKQVCASIQADIAKLQTWVKQVVNDSQVGNGTHPARASFGDLCALSEQLLSAATELTALAIQVTQAAQLIHTDEKNA
jgi:hypothetical protein